MAISEATALARAAAVRKTFPKGKITIAQAKQMVLAVADSQVGYASGNPNYSPYGAGKNWRTKGTWNWQGYWCYRGPSWCFDYAFGAPAAIAGIGQQNHILPAGWAATWLGMAWMRARGMEVHFRNAQPGDISFQSWGRTTNASDHVELVTGTWNGSLPCIGFNTSSASVTTGAAVARVRRPSYPLVGTFRPDWAALVAVYNATVVAEEVIDFTKVAVALRDLGYTADEKGVREFQSDKDDWGHNLVVDGVPGPATERELEIAVSKIDEVLNILNHHIRGDLDAEDKKGLDTGRNLPLREVIILSGVRTNDNRKTLIRVSDQLNVVGRVAAQAREYARTVPDRLIASRVPFKEGTSLHKLFGKDFRLGALLGYAGAAFVDRDTHTEEIVEALDDTTLDVGDPHVLEES